MLFSAPPGRHTDRLRPLLRKKLPDLCGLLLPDNDPPPEGENESNDSKLTVLIQTRNFGNVKGVFTLTTSNSVDIYILCTEDFPKKTLQKSLMEESSSHAMNTTIDIEAVEPKKKETFEEPEAKVNLSATNEMNPYLLLMAHAFIRNTIFIDSNAIVEEPNS